MRAGTLRERVTFQRLASSTDVRWGESTVWQDLAEVAADVRPLGSDEAFDAKGVATSRRYAIVVRYSPAVAGLTSKDRVAWRGRSLDVTGVVNTDNRNRELVVEAVQHG